MRTTCENCRTVYEPAGTDPAFFICPYCEHVNRPQAGAEALQPDPVMEDHDPFQTMLVPMDDEPGPVRIAEVDSVAAKRSVGMELVVLVEGKPATRHAIRAPRMTIGRGLCDIRLQDPGISREHCSIEVLDGVPVLKDLKSANGTRLNQEFVTEHALADGDEIQVGSTVLRFHLVKSE